MPRVLTTMLALASLCAVPALAAPVLPQVGGWVLLLGGGSRGPEGTHLLTVPSLTDARGQATEVAPWLGRPLRVVAETATAFQLQAAGDKAWLPKRDLAAKAAFPLVQDAQTRTLANVLNSHVWFNGTLRVTCQPFDGYDAFLTAQRARVRGVWRVQVKALNLSPKGGPVQADMVFNERSSDAALLVMFDHLNGVEKVGAAYGGDMTKTDDQIKALVAQRCVTLPGLYANADDLYRNLSTTPLTKRPSLPVDPDAAEKALIGWTRAQVLAQYGSPNAPGSLADLMRLSVWDYGEIPYNSIYFEFGKSGRVTRASIARSP